MKKIRFCLIGRGAIGTRHVKNLKSLSFHDIIAYSEAYDEEKNRKYKRDYGVETIQDVNKLRDYSPDAVIIANPTSKHIKAAEIALDMGCHIFMEKPLSHNLNGVSRFGRKIREKKRVFFSANCLRFHPVVQGIKKLIHKNAFGKIYFARIQAGQYLPDWHPEEDYRKSYAARADLGGGVVLTLQHEIDYAYWFLGGLKSVRSVAKKVSDLQIGVEDIASVVIETEGGQLVEIHLDYLQRPARRSIQIQGSSGSVEYVFGERFLRFYDFQKKKYKNILDMKDYDSNQMYLDEMKHFIRCIQRKDKPLIGLEDSIYVLKACLRIKKGS
jgi:predicted dehydrogenase